MKIWVDIHCPAASTKGTYPPCSHIHSLLVREKCCKTTVSFLFITFAILNCWWFLFLPHQADMLISASKDHHRSSSTSNSSSLNTSLNQTKSAFSHSSGNVCDPSRGKWIPDLRPPLYTNETCKYIQANQNCMKNGRPDRGYLSWKWKPHDCELPEFDSAVFLELMRGKKLVFIGDSIARNQMQALLCALSQVEDPQDLYHDRKENSKWGFPSYNFTLTNFWSPFLVKHTLEEGIYKLQLDMPDEMWSSPLPAYDIAIISTGYWYFRPSIYYFNSTTLGTNPSSGVNLTTFEILPAIKIALENVLKYMVNKYTGITMLRTVTVPHFESGSWTNGGACNKTQPFFEPDHMQLPLPWISKEMNKIQVHEFEKAVAIQGGSSRLKLLNVTYSAFMRPDGHPGSYRIQSPSEPRNDCLHWCLPGPIDMWNQLLLHTIQRGSTKLIGRA